MTFKEYIDKGASNCIVCESNNIKYLKHLTADGTTGRATVICNDCKSQWDEVFTLTDVDFVINTQEQ